jgi:hypothetical protein
LIDTEDPALLAHRCDWEDSTVIAVHNLGPRPASAEVALGDGAKGVHDLLADVEERAGRGGRLAVELEGYGGRWLRVLR